MPERDLTSQFQVLDSEDPEYVFDERTKSFWVKNSKDFWVSVKESSFRRHLRRLGKSIKKQEGDTLCELESIVEVAELDHRVPYAGPLAGHWSGFTTMCGNHVLITEDPDLVEPVKPNDDDRCLADGSQLCGVTDCRGWPVLGQLIGNLLSHEDVGDVQLMRYFGYIAHILDCLYDRQHSKVIALLIAGERECGKTLLFNDIHAVLFGGKIGKPYDWMIGKENFNDDFLGAVLLTVDDEVNNTHMDARNTLGEKLKKMVANSEQRLRGMHKSGFVLKPLWAPTVMVNLEPANLLVLPPIEEDNADKFMIFKAYKQDMPMPAETKAERAAFWATLMSEIPKFVWWIRNEWKTPDDIQGRFGVKYWHHPEVVEALLKLSPAWVIWEYIQRTIFKDPIRYQDPRNNDTLEGFEWVGTVSELRTYLADTKYSDGETPRPRLTMEEARSLPQAQWLGRRLAKIAEKYPECVSQVRTATARFWHIRVAEEEEDDGSDGK